MGKVVQYLSILIFIDILFIATGQICNSGVGCSLGSILLNSVLDLKNVLNLNFWTQFIGSITDLFSSATGIGSLIVGGTVVVGSLFLPSDIRLFIPLTFSLALLASDLVFIASYLFSLNVLLATFIMAPLSIIYVFVVVEWLRGKD